MSGRDSAYTSIPDAGFNLPMSSTFLPEMLTFLEMAAKYDFVPIYSERTYDELDITVLYEKLNPNPPSCLLESLAGSENGRYSIIGCQAFHTISFPVKGYTSSVDPLNQFLSQHKVPPLDLIPFYGGLMGFWNYDLGPEINNLESRHKDNPTQFFFVPRMVIVYDRFSKILRVLIWIEKEQATTENYGVACHDIAGIMDLASQCNHRPNFAKKPVAQPEGEFEVNIPPACYHSMVKTAKDHIRVGDIFQVVLSRRWKRLAKVPPWKVYLSLREVNPSPYMFFLDTGNLALFGSSPEMLARVINRRVTTRPIAGTRKITGSPTKDAELKRELLSDDKERAEHLMLVDLGRNDVGRVCRAGTVKVREFMIIESCSHVVHLVSTVDGDLKPSVSSLQAFLSCFPAGTLTGAPKRKAMEIIYNLEEDSRGPYGGGIGYLGFNGDLDACITIRAVTCLDGYFYVQSGAGIVADSDPELEEQETVNKAKALMIAILDAEGKI